MRLLTTVAGLRAFLAPLWSQKTIGLVPTMGALHPGHQSLIERARLENDIVIVSIFVNPLQFVPGEDFQNYPRTLDTDRQFCQGLGVDVIFAPSLEEMNGTKETLTSLSQATTRIIPPTSMTIGLCGKTRPGHFQGVATIVTKLFSLIKPTSAYFGEKDAQQLAIIRRLVQDLLLGVEIRTVATVRETSGLAYSSRNQYLTPAEKEQASILYRSLRAAEAAFQGGERQSSVLCSIAEKELATVNSVKVEYLELVHPTNLEPLNVVTDTGLLAIAARLGTTRLIDNITLRQRQPIIAIDGPAGVGKSTVTKKIAQALGFTYLDTGAMYRAMTWLALEVGIPVDDEIALAEIVSRSSLQFKPGAEGEQQVFVNGEDVTQAIRSLAVTAQVSAVAKVPAVREHLVQQQRQWGEKGGLVAEGRDMGTIVFPDAELKIFLTASVAERARRRLQDVQSQGLETVSLEELSHQIEERDRLDSTRQVAPLRPAPDAIEVSTDGMGIEAVTEHILDLYAKGHLVRSRMFSGQS